MANRFIPEPPSLEKLQGYVSYAKRLRKVCVSRKFLYRMNSSGVVLYALFLSNYLSELRGSIGDHTRITSGTVNQFVKTNKNRLESAVQGFTGGYIDERTFKDEVSFCLRELKHVARELSSKYNAKTIFNKTESVKLNSFDQLGQYMNELQKVSEKIDEIKSVDTKEQIKPETNKVDDVAVKLEKIFNDINRQIKIPNLSQEHPWSVTRLPIFVATTPFLSENSLRILGIKYHRLPTGIILENQLVLCMYSRYVPDSSTDPKPLKKSSFQKDLDPTFNSVIFIRASNMISHNMKEEFVYSDAFSSTEVHKPIKFMWMMTHKMVNSLGRFRINSLGLPYAPELNKAENVGQDTIKMRQRIEKENRSKDEIIKARNDALAPIVKERDSIKDKYEENKKKVKRLRSEINELNATVEVLTQNLSRMKNRDDSYMETKLRLEAAVSRINRLKMEEESLVGLYMPLLKEQISRLQVKLTEFVKNYGK